MSAQLALGALTLFVLVRLVSCYRAGVVSNALVSSLAAVMYLFCLWVPAVLQSQGKIDSKILTAGVTSLPSAAEVDSLAWLWFIELIVVLAMEILAVYVFSRRHAKESKHSIGDWKSISIFLVCVGAIATVVFPAELENRAAEGQGLLVLLRTCLVCGLAIIAFYGGFNSRKMWILLGLGTAFLVVENVRSPLFVILIALASGLVVRNRIYSRKVLASVLIVGVLAIGSAAFMSQMRANVVRGHGLTASEIFADMADDPVRAVYAAGVDTLDGYRFVDKIAHREPARPFDLLSPVTTFIPRAIWEDKPASISVEVSSKYLGYRSSGQFLSMMGYLRLATGGYVSALLLFAVFFFVTSALVQTFRRQLWLAIVMVVVFRMLLGGSAFDIYYGLVLTVIIGGAAILLDVFRSLTRREPNRLGPVAATNNKSISRL
ncbi:hypothetical protein [Rhodococcus rhodochrous]|uniref:hypothetical protein n=1 Tax=Rhodococcus rhodochrous TaxID=1829 RepID=UPI000A48D7DE|nr:hypothetical protein [Rhodococcus rhodochrous]MBF4478311.1 hypothetical protein [Rhodococcus rhodochrous]MDO1486872.1 hypothetical protein [Rhodococcus rhodochrous]SNV24870.1 Uncharacterised protein [Rhodococcus rhodochrous]